MNIQCLGDLDRLQVYLEDRFTTHEIWLINSDLAIETTGTKQGRIQYIRTVGGSKDNDPHIGTKPIHFHK